MLLKVSLQVLTALIYDVGDVSLNSRLLDHYVRFRTDKWQFLVGS